jgi:putative DNA primase/helicase
LYETVASTDANATERTINLKSDLAELSRTLAEIGDVALVIIDPINAYMGGMDSHKNTEIRAVLAPPSDLAEKHGTAVVCVSHLTKSSGTEAMMRVNRCLAFVATARAALLVAKNKGNERVDCFCRLG